MRLLALLLLLFDQGTLQQVVVQTSLGAIQGKILTSQFGAPIYTFLAIPYAIPPINERRFTAPEPALPWNGTLIATTDAPACPQLISQPAMSEDCLKLNVYSPDLNGSASVIVYIHGGANVGGSGSNFEVGPQYLLDHNVVLVTFNYRLGPFGFLSTGTKEAPGNFAFLDQVLVLKWVQDHISNFGGNPKSVTLMGWSAGSMAVTLHMASPLSRNLFHRAIAMSGSATNAYAIDNVGWTQRLARECGCPMYGAKNIVDCLRKVPWEKIIAITLQWEPYFFVNIKWNYQIDNHFLYKHPSQYFREGNFKHMPIMIGTTRHEFDFSVYNQENNTGLLHDIGENFVRYAPELFQYQSPLDFCFANKSKRIQTFYFGKQTNISKDNLYKFGEIISDSVIGHATHRLVQLAKKYTNVYYYRFDYLGRKSAYVDDQGHLRGVGHGDDLRYVAPGINYGLQMSIDDPDMFMVNRSTLLVTNFAKTGVPTAPGVVSWPPCSNTTTLTFYNDKVTRMDQPPYTDRYALWDSLFPWPPKSKQILKDWSKCLTDLFNSRNNIKVGP